MEGRGWRGLKRLTGTYPIVVLEQTGLWLLLLRVAKPAKTKGEHLQLFLHVKHGNFLQDKKQDDTSGTLLKAGRGDYLLSFLLLCKVRAAKQHATQLNS